MGDETEVRAKSPVVPKNEFDPTFNRVDSTDRTDTSGTAQPSKFQTEAWSKPDGAVSMPPGSVVEVDGKIYPSDKVVIQHADVVNIYQGGDNRDPRVARVEDNGDYIGDNYPEYSNRGPYRIGHLPYDPGMQNPNSYHEMLRRGPKITVDIGGQRHFPYRPQPFHPQHCFGDEPGPFYGHGGPRARINVGGIRIGDVTLGGSFNIPLGGNNDRDRGWGDQGWRQPGWSQPGWSQPDWSQPSWGAPRVDVTANIDLHRRHHAQPCHDNYSESHNGGRVAANRARFNERMMAARQEMEMRRQRHS